ncbi:adenylyl-sulfate kinase [Amycolatopsis sp. MtRt-6]|uniref:adenylyl-sulfate kinase n=1 Tax=Amycolatopsis sp. MtRt-6 TaxID=2792782 RepID=UPI001A8F6F64|nr:adenylyl-sulfate kinase [Amycolatopsis sp. MtRt-6]
MTTVLAAQGLTLWLTGLPSSGKSTIAQGVAGRLRSGGRRVEVLDGDEVRRNLSGDLGFSRADREENVRRIGFIAGLLSGHGVITLVPVIAPYADSRAQVRVRHAEKGVAFAEVYVATPVEICSARDVKGLYAKQRAGVLSGLTGVDDPYEAPRAPELVIPAHSQSVAESVDAVHAFVLSALSPSAPPKRGRP